jgi:Transposase DDE domain
MKEPWCLAASNAEASSAMLVNYYAKRWTIEPNFRDIKDLRFGLGLGVTRIGEPTRRDRLLLIRPERWLGESEQSDKWFPCLMAALMPRSRREHVETITAQP